MVFVFNSARVFYTVGKYLKYLFFFTNKTDVEGDGRFLWGDEIYFASGLNIAVFILSVPQCRVLRTLDNLYWQLPFTVADSIVVQ